MPTASPSSFLAPPRRGVRPLGWLLLAIFAAAGCRGDRDAAPKPHVVEMVWHGPGTESPEGELLAPPQLTHREVLEQLHAVATDEAKRGLFLRAGIFGSAWARAQDTIRALDAIREAGKPVHCHLETADNLGYAMLAGHCDEVTITPSGLINLVGLRAQGIYARQALEHLGLTAEMLHVGKYKGAADTVTMDRMPDTARQTLNDLLDATHAELLSQLAARPALADRDLQALLDAGPYTAEAARAAGLVDRIAYDDEARQRTRDAAGVKDVERAPERPDADTSGFGALLSALTGGLRRGDVEGPHIGLAYLDGTIVRGGSADGPGGSAEAERFVKQFRKWADDADVRAVVLRIHSPGGSALASDLMWHAVRRVSGRKPVIVSIGDMAASGGYYVASAGTEIFTEETSLVGSIGVVGGKIVARDLAERIGVHSEVLKRGTNANWLDPLSPLDESERSALQGMLERTYRLFIRRVAQGRKMARGDVETMAEGRVMPGKEALAGGLVDTVGGMEAAIARARTLADVPEDTELEVWPAREGFFEQLSRAMGHEETAASAAQLAGRLLPPQLDPWRNLPLLSVLLSAEAGAATLLPYGIEIR